MVGVRQMYGSLGTPMVAVAEHVRAMKATTTTMLSGDKASEVGAYFDYLINALT